MGNASTSSLNLSRVGHVPMTAVPEDDVNGVTGQVTSDGDAESENEMEEIRRRREDVSKRYEARLDYLRAKLKGAQLHEKLMRK